MKKNGVELNLKDWTECIFEEDGGEKLEVRGYLELHVDGYGYLRNTNYGFESRKIFVAHTLIKRHSLKQGDMIDGSCEEVAETNMKILRSVSFVNGKDPSINAKIEDFDTFTARYPKERITLAKENQGGAEKAVDLFCPIGKGQRCLILDNGTNQKTALVKKIAESISENQSAELTVFLAGASPEDITDLKEGISSEVVGTLFCDDVESVIRTFNLVVERAKREVERGKNKVLIIDSISPIVNAFNDCKNLQSEYVLQKNEENGINYLKTIFGKAGNFGDRGSLTIIATLTKDESEENYKRLKEIASCEISLTKRNGKRGVFVDLEKSWTKKDELLLSDSEIEFVDSVRERLANGELSLEEADGKIDGFKG